MKLVDLLKNKRNKILQLEEQNKDGKKIDTDNIKIIIKNSSGFFDNEEEMIKEGALNFLETGKVDDMEDAIITSATILRGLKYDKTEKDENGNIIIIFKDIVLAESPAKNNK